MLPCFTEGWVNGDEGRADDGAPPYDDHHGGRMARGVRGVRGGAQLASLYVYRSGDRPAHELAYYVDHNLNRSPVNSNLGDVWREVAHCDTCRSCCLIKLSTACCRRVQR